MIGYTQGLSDLFRCYFKLQCRSNRWQADDKGIPIVFSPYKAAYYAWTSGPLTMSWESLKWVLNPGFEIPQ